MAILIYNLIGSGNESVREILPMKTGLIALSFATAVSVSCRYRQFRPAQKYAFHSSVALGLLIKGAVVMVAFTQHPAHWRVEACRSSPLAMACIGWFVVGATRGKRLS